MAYYQKVSAQNKQGYRWKCTEDAPKHPVTGKRRQVTRRADTKKESLTKVESAIEEMLKIDRGDLNGELKEITVAQLFEQWLELNMKRKLKETTFKEYTNTTKNRILPALGDYKVSSLNTMILQKFINNLSDEGYSPRYVEYISTIFYGCLESARIWKIIDSNPLVDVKKPRPRRREYITWTVEEMNHMLNVTKLEDTRMYTLFSLVLKTGLRRGEVLALKWSDIDLEELELSVERSLVYDKDGFRFSTPKTESSIRKIKLGESLIGDLNNWKSKQNELKMLLRDSYKDHDLIFTTRTGKPIFPRDVTYRFSKYIEIAGVPIIRFHDLRHTHATLCLESGMTLKDVQDRLGHGSIKTTGDVYAHVTDKMRNKSTDLFENHIVNKSN